MTDKRAAELGDDAATLRRRYAYHRAPRPYRIVDASWHDPAIHIEAEAVVDGRTVRARAVVPGEWIFDKAVEASGDPWAGKRAGDG